jgi:hypothetical protein
MEQKEQVEQEAKEQTENEQKEQAEKEQADKMEKEKETKEDKPEWTNSPENIHPTVEHGAEERATRDREALDEQKERGATAQALGDYAEMMSGALENQSSEKTEPLGNTERITEQMSSPQPAWASDTPQDATTGLIVSTAMLGTYAYDKVSGMFDKDTTDIAEAAQHFSDNYTPEAKEQDIATMSSNAETNNDRNWTTGTSEQTADIADSAPTVEVAVDDKAPD